METAQTHNRGPGEFASNQAEKHQFTIDSYWAERLRKLVGITDIQDRMARIRSKDFSGRPHSVIRRYLQNQLVYLPFETTITRPYNIDRFPIYRARANIDENKENVNLARTFSYPNPTFCTSNGRANLSRFPVFYCSDVAGTAVAELRPKVDDIVFLSEWVIRCHRPNRHASFFPPTIDSPNPWITIAANKRKGRVTFFEKYFGKEATAKVDEIFSFLGELFLHENPPYSITSSIAFHLIYNRLVDYIIYPSFITRAGSCNLAFHPNFVDEFFRIDRVFMLGIDKAEQHGAAVKVMAVAEYFQNFLAWREPREDEDLPSMYIPDSVFQPIVPP